MPINMKYLYITCIENIHELHYNPLNIHKNYTYCYVVYYLSTIYIIIYYISLLYIYIHYTYHIYF